VREVLEILESVEGVKALVHITSDGLLNLTRVAAPVGYIIDKMPPIPPIFSLIKHWGRVSEAEMFQVYNMGVGFCIVVSPSQCDRVLAILKSHGREASQIGRAKADPKKQVYVDDRLVGRGKRFYPL
jgi:phosphoribosylformylglycinamidine cyclo-ligase